MEEPIDTFKGFGIQRQRMTEVVAQSNALCVKVQFAAHKNHLRLPQQDAGCAILGQNPAAAEPFKGGAYLQVENDHCWSPTWLLESTLQLKEAVQGIGDIDSCMASALREGRTLQPNQNVNGPT